MTQENRHQNAILWKSLLLTIIPVFLFHGIILGNDFIWDDYHLVVGHPDIDTPGFFFQCFLRDYGLEFGPRQPTGYYRPIFMGLVTLIYKISGTSTILYRLLSLFTLTLIGWISSLFLHRVTGNKLALYTGMVIACHPLYSTTVAFLANWPDLALGLYGLVALICVIKLTRPTTTHTTRALLYLALFLITLIAGITKASGVFTMCGLMIGSLAFGVRKWKYISLYWLVTALGILTVLLIRSYVGISHPTHTSWSATLFYPLLPENSLVILWGLGKSLLELIIPHDCPHSYENSELLLNPNNLPAWTLITQSGVAMVVLIIAVIILWLILSKRPLYSMLFAWATMGSWPMLMSLSFHLPYSERYLAVTPAVLLACLVTLKWILTPTRMNHSPWSQKIILALLLYILLLGAFTFKSSVRPMNSKSFWTMALDEHPKSLAAHIGLARVYFAENDMELGEYHALAAINLNPSKAQSGKIGNFLGWKAITENKGMDAYKWYSWTLERYPDEILALRGQAIALSILGEYTQARNTMAYAISKSPNSEFLYRDGARIVAASKDLTPEQAAQIITPWLEKSADIDKTWGTAQGIIQYRLDSEEQTTETKDQPEE